MSEMMTTQEAEGTALAPVANSTRGAVVVTAIRKAILSGELAPGQRIKEAALAETLGVSRPTVREAMNKLVHEGSLVQIPYKGVHVASPTPSDLLDVAEVRVSLETLAAQKLGAAGESAGLDRLRAALRTHVDAVESGDVVAADMTHLEFHRTLWESAGNEMLGKIWPLIASRIQPAMAFDQVTRADPRRDIALHERLVQVIAEGDPEAIAAEVRDHIARSADEVVHLIAQR